MKRSGVKYCTTLGIMLLAIILSGCQDGTTTVYLFGPAKSCFTSGKLADCNRLRVYDKVDIKVLVERQEVSYVQAAHGLDASNTVFKRLENCKVVSADSFSCDGLVKSNGAFTDTKAFGQLFVSQSYWTYLFSSYGTKKSGQDREMLRFFSDHDTGVTIGIVVIGLLALLGMLSGS